MSWKSNKWGGGVVDRDPRPMEVLDIARGIKARIEGQPYPDGPTSGPSNAAMVAQLLDPTAIVAPAAGNMTAFKKGWSAMDLVIQGQRAQGLGGSGAAAGVSVGSSGYDAFGRAVTDGVVNGVRTAAGGGAANELAKWLLATDEGV